MSAGAMGLSIFQSTPSVWRATTRRIGSYSDASFQSTPSVWRATLDTSRNWYADNDFNPRPPCGGRPGRAPPPWV